MPIKSQSIAVINTQSSFNNANAREALDLSLIFAAFDQQVTVIYQDDGVYQLLANQQPQHIEGKNFLATIKAFPLYDIHQVIVSQDAMLARGISSQQIQIPHHCMTDRQIAQLWQGFRHILVI